MTDRSQLFGGVRVRSVKVGDFMLQNDQIRGHQDAGFSRGFGSTVASSTLICDALMNKVAVSPTRLGGNDIFAEMFPSFFQAVAYDKVVVADGTKPYDERYGQRSVHYDAGRCGGACFRWRRSF